MADAYPAQRDGRAGRPRSGVPGLLPASAAISSVTASTRAARAPSSGARCSSADRRRAVLPYDPLRDEVVLIRQFRAGAYVAGRHPWTWEIVAGIIEHDEIARGPRPARGRRGGRARDRRRHRHARRDAEPGRLLGDLRDLPRPGRHDEGRRNVRPGVGRREHPGQGPAVRRGPRHARARRDRQRHRRDRPAVAGAASRRGAARWRSAIWRPRSCATRRPYCATCLPSGRGSAGQAERARHGCPVGFHR